MYRAGIEGILGLRREGADLVVDPRVPRAWPGFEARVTVGSTRYDIRVEAESHGEVGHALLDGVWIETAGPVRVPLDGMIHTLRISIGPKRAIAEQVGIRGARGERACFALLFNLDRPRSRLGLCR